MARFFHSYLNRMVLFTTLLFVGIIYFYADFMQIASANIWLNGIIIGTALFGIGLCFVQMIRLLPEYKWLHGLISGGRRGTDGVRILRPVAQVLSHRQRAVSPAVLDSVAGMVQIKFEDLRESVRYITNTLIFLGLLGTFWGLILTIGGFAELIGSLDMSDETVLGAMQVGLTRPLAGMTTAFTSSLLGLAGSLAVGFLSLQVQMAQNVIFNELIDWLSLRVRGANPIDTTKILPQIDASARELTRTMHSLEQKISQI